MTTIDLATAYPVDDDDLTRLHARLAAAAERRRPARRRLSDGRLPGRLAADRRDTRRAGARGIQQRGPRRRAAEPVRPDQLPTAARPGPPGRRRAANSTSISPDVVTPSTFRWIGSSPKDFAASSSATWPSTSATAPPPATAPWPDFRVHPRPFAPWGRPARPTRSRSWCRATGWSAPTAPWAATAADRPPNARCWIWKASHDARSQPGLASRRHHRGHRPRSMDGQSGRLHEGRGTRDIVRNYSRQGLDHLRPGVQRPALRTVGTQSLHPVVLSRRGGRICRGSSTLRRMPPQRLQRLPADVA